MDAAFQKLSRVRTPFVTTKWYLSEDCLLAAKRVMYSVEYRRFYLQDLESIVVWPSRAWIWRMIVPGVVFGLFGFAFWQWINYTAGLIVSGIGVLWVGLEAALGPTAKASIRTTGATVDLPLVARTRRARRVLAKIDAAVRATRTAAQPVAAAASPAPASQPTETSAASSLPAIDGTPTHGS